MAVKRSAKTAACDHCGIIKAVTNVEDDGKMLEICAPCEKIHGLTKENTKLRKGQALLFDHFTELLESRERLCDKVASLSHKLEMERKDHMIALHDRATIKKVKVAS